MINWLSKIKIADLDTDLQSIGVKPEVVQFVKTQPQPNWFVNVLKKNPHLDINTLQQTVKPPQKQSPYTLQEINFCRQFKSVLGDWPLIQMRKLRMSGVNNGNSEDNYGGYSVALLSNFFHDISDWFRAAKRQNPQLQISSYTLDQARQSSSQWHREIAEQGENLEYEPSNPANIVYGPQWKNPKFEGWTIQKVTSENDLTVEGNRMNHCVGGYCEQVNDGSSEIYSLRDQNNRPHVTIEMDKTVGLPQIKQIQGRGNSEPKELYKSMVTEWLSTLNGKVQMESGAGRYATTKLIESLPNLDRNQVFNVLENEIYKGDYGLTPSFAQFDGKRLYDRLVPHISHNETNDPEQEKLATQRMANDYAKIIWKSAKDSITRWYWIWKPKAERLSEWYDKAGEFLEDINRNGGYEIVRDFISNTIHYNTETHNRWAEFVKSNPANSPPKVVEMVQTPFEQTKNGQFLYRVQELFKQFELQDPLPIDQYAEDLRNTKTKF